MSYVTSVTVVCPYITDQMADALTAPLPFDDRQQSLSALDTTTAGGTKYHEGNVFAAGFNYLDTEAFRDWISALPWNSFEWAVVVTDTEGHDDTVYCVGSIPQPEGWWGR